MTLDRFRPGTGGRIADVLQLPELLGEPADAVSPALVRLAVRRASEALAGSDWASLWNRRRTAMRGSALLFALLVPALFAALAPHAARSERGALAARLDGALAAAELPHGHGPGRPRPARSLPATSRSPSRSGPTCRRSRLAMVDWLVAGRGEPLLLRDPSRRSRDA